MDSGINQYYGISNATFFAPSTGGTPKIWASGNVNGTYTGTPTGSSFGLTGYQPGTVTTNGINAQFNVQQWTGSKWGATVTNGTVPANTTGFTYTNSTTTGLNFQGAAAGTIGTGTFSGTAAGIVK